MQKLDEMNIHKDIVDQIMAQLNDSFTHLKLNDILEKLKVIT